MTRWHIEIQNSQTFQWERLHPTLDGAERVFRTRRAAEEYGYDYQLIGQRPNAGGHRFVKEQRT